MEHIEYEERVLITYRDYKKIIDDMMQMGHICEPFTIENIYLDNKESFIEKNDMMLRIRNTSTGLHELTLKIANEDGSHVEINETLRKHPLIDDILQNKFKEFKEVTKLMTERIEVQFKDHLFVIDKNYYSGIIDYNIEVESTSQKKAKEIMMRYCEKYHIDWKKKCPSKSARAFKALKKGRR